jgi:hypothetical protein
MYFLVWNSFSGLAVYAACISFYEFSFFIVILVDDRLPFRIVDGVRHQAGKRIDKKIKAEIAKKRAANKDEAGPASKKQKAAYMVNAKKVASSATEEEMALELSEADLGTEDTYRILQCKIR